MSSKFLARPDEGLEEHLRNVARRAKTLLEDAPIGKDERILDSAFYAGAFHDLGKLNPYYQGIFAPVGGLPISDAMMTVLKKEFGTRYVPEHSLFSSSWAETLFKGTIKLDTLIPALITIAGHHGRLSTKHGGQTADNQNNQKVIRTQTDSIKNIRSFLTGVGADFFESRPGSGTGSTLKQYALSRVDNIGKWGTYLPPPKPISDYPDSFLIYNLLYSTLICADRGSFGQEKIPEFDIALDTSPLVKRSDKLTAFRNRAADEILSGVQTPPPGILVIKAPTGIGKTRIVLEIVKRYAKAHRFSKVIYFAPFLALVDDLEGKILSCMKNSQDMITYTSSYIGRTDKQSDSNPEGTRDYNYEAFNKPFILTTTQRLLMTLYYNNGGDKMKLMAFKNAVLIVDEVQTIPKVCLPSLLSQLSQLHKLLGTNSILLSATVSEEIKNFNQCTLVEANNVEPAYLKIHECQINHIAPPPFKIDPTIKTMVMVNTRKKALGLYDSLRQSLQDAELTYITTGIRKGDRRRSIKKIISAPNATVVATQVLEAGVDVSFRTIYREYAPLDNVIQALGRLNRECEWDDAVLHLFSYEAGKEDWLPYSELEWKVSRKYIDQCKTSIDLYHTLPKYYAEVVSRSGMLAQKREALAKSEKDLDFDAVYEQIEKITRDEKTIIVPPTEEELKTVLGTLRSIADTHDKPKTRLSHLLRKWDDFTATVPVGKETEVRCFCDTDIFDRLGILVPIQGALSSIYDEKIGLDKLLKSDSSFF